VTPQEIIECVRDLDRTADAAIWLMGYPSNAAYGRAREAGHCALRLIRLSEAVARADGKPVQLFDPQEFERRVAFMEGPKR